MADLARSIFQFGSKGTASENGAKAPATVAQTQDSPMGSTHINTSALITDDDPLMQGGLESGQSTPEPSVTDKRLPSIAHRFQQMISAPQTPRGTVTEGTGNTTSFPYTQPVGPRGRLLIKIIEARNLTVSKSNSEPYVVCSFESNEFISRGPKTDTRERSDHKGGVSIPKSRQSSSTSLNELRGNTSIKMDGRSAATDPLWGHEAYFDVLGDSSELTMAIFDRANSDAFQGHVRIRPVLTDEHMSENWFKLESRASSERVTGEIKVQTIYEKISKKHYGPDDFQILRLIGKGTFGQVYQVRKKDTGRIYAMKVLSKKVIVQKKEVAHTVGERNILVRTATTDSPFIVGLKFSFQTPTDLYLVTDYMSGGELFWHLQREGKFSEDRAKFYIAELILALEHLHNHDIVYRDLKPENILLDAYGHIALCDFGLSKANLTPNATTNTFCGTTEYLAPEVLLDDAGYTKMVDFWSLGVLVFEMCCGWSPFYAEDTQQMYKNIAFGKVRFPKDTLSTEGRNFVKGLLNRNPKHRLGATRDAKELKEHPFFGDVEWESLLRKSIPPPFKPALNSETDTSNFDPEFTNVPTEHFQNKGGMPASTPISPGMQENFRGFTFVGESSMDNHFQQRGKSLDRMDEDAHGEEASARRSNDDDEDEGDDEARRRESVEGKMQGVLNTNEDTDVFNTGHGNFDI